MEKSEGELFKVWENWEGSKTLLLLICVADVDGLGVFIGGSQSSENYIKYYNLKILNKENI